MIHRRWWRGTNGVTVDRLQVAAWSDPGGFAGAASVFTHAEFLAGAGQDQMREWLGQTALDEVVAFVAGLPRDPAFAREEQALADTRAFLDRLPEEARLDRRRPRREVRGTRSEAPDRWTTECDESSLTVRSEGIDGVLAAHVTPRSGGVPRAVAIPVGAGEGPGNALRVTGAVGLRDRFYLSLGGCGWRVLAADGQVLDSGGPPAVPFEDVFRFHDRIRFQVRVDWSAENGYSTTLEYDPDRGFIARGEVPRRAPFRAPQCPPPTPPDLRTPETGVQEALTCRELLDGMKAGRLYLAEKLWPEGTRLECHRYLVSFAGRFLEFWYAPRTGRFHEWRERDEEAFRRDALGIELEDRVRDPARIRPGAELPAELSSRLAWQVERGDALLRELAAPGTGLPLRPAVEGEEWLLLRHRGGWWFAVLDDGEVASCSAWEPERAREDVHDVLGVDPHARVVELTAEVLAQVARFTG